MPRLTSTQDRRSRGLTASTRLVGGSLLMLLTVSSCSREGGCRQTTGDGLCVDNAVAPSGKKA